MTLPQSFVEWLVARNVISRPRFLCVDVQDTPLQAELQPGYVFREKQGRHPKWAHLLCPKCGDHIQLPIGGSRGSWRLKLSFLRKPTLHPSVWERQSCGAHFWVRSGCIDWCAEEHRSKTDLRA